MLKSEFFFEGIIDTLLSFALANLFFSFACKPKYVFNVDLLPNKAKLKIFHL